ncbi:GDSL family lipase [Gluconacetobacter diazotrophicus]|uniref:GDSL family lipase n=1 Tax=Gluconacetobacter diazotrophicus TaxID=33996 RepID=A0A7W4NPB9_GLUDI|nr:GDSL-type esterase/lipase family protein [Gluconacetobacter diazotrophicus]MBB2158055.1 GDSL family lipase [Gluconacetobacter diazotrophicus]
MTEALPWHATWTQAVTDFRGEEDEPGFANATVRMTVPASLDGSRVRLELSNRFGDAAVRIGRGAIGIGGQFFEVAFDGLASTEIPPGESRRTDPIALTVRHSDEIVVDLYLPEPTPYATAAGFRFSRSAPGDFVGASPFPLDGGTSEAIDESREFPAANTGAAGEPDETGWSLPAGGPFLRAIEVAGVKPRAVIVALGGSSTAMGWPQYTAALLPADAKIAVVNRGIAGNRIRLDAPPLTPSWGRSGLSRFDEDVLGTAGATHLVIAYNSNDWGLPGRIAPMAEMPSVNQLIEAYQELIDRAQAAGLRVILSTVMPLAPELLAEPEREDMRLVLNAWIRGSGHVVDFDAAVRSETDPSRLAAKYAAPDDTHPSVNGSKRLAQAMVDILQRLKLWPAEDV